MPHTAGELLAHRAVVTQNLLGLQLVPHKMKVACDVDGVFFHEAAAE